MHDDHVHLSLNKRECQLLVIALSSLRAAYERNALLRANEHGENDSIVQEWQTSQKQCDELLDCIKEIARD